MVRCMTQAYLSLTLFCFQQPPIISRSKVTIHYINTKKMTSFRKIQYVNDTNQRMFFHHRTYMYFDVLKAFRNPSCLFMFYVIVLTVFLQEHLQAQCAYETVECSNRCGHSLRRKDLQQHLLRECTNRTTVCRHCKKPIPHAESEASRTFL